MITEIATFEIKVGKNADFEAALEKAGKIISQSKGHIGFQFNKCMEQETRYMLIIRWETLEDHTVGFRESELFTQWRSLIAPFFRTPPFVLHYETKFEM